MYKMQLVVLVIVVAAFHSVPGIAAENACSEQMSQIEQALRQAGHLSEDEIQSQVEDLGRLCNRLEQESADTASTGSAQPKDDLPMAGLNLAYLEGTWCGVTGGQERGPWVFASDGSYRIGIRAGSGFSLQQAGDSIDHFHARFDRLASRSQDEFIVFRHSRESVFTRGECT